MNWSIVYHHLRTGDLLSIVLSVQTSTISFQLDVPPFAFIFPSNERISPIISLTQLNQGRTACAEKEIGVRKQMPTPVESEFCLFPSSELKDLAFPFVYNPTFSSENTSSVTSFNVIALPMQMENDGTALSLEDGLSRTPSVISLSTALGLAFGSLNRRQTQMLFDVNHPPPGIAPNAVLSVSQEVVAKPPPLERRQRPYNTSSVLLDTVGQTSFSD